METKKNPYEIVAESIIKSLEDGNIPAWRKTWVSANNFPTSLSSKKAYRGTNQLLLMFATMANGYGSMWWGTYKQIEASGGKVRKGEKSTPVVLWKPIETTNKDGVLKKSAVMRYFNVFNADQAEWEDGKMPSTPKPEHRDSVSIIAEAQAVVDAYFSNDTAPSLSFGGDRAFYSPSRDAVTMPEQSAFSSDEEFYSTLFHEAGHSTGHSKRLGRDGIVEGHSFGDALYSEEELVAEFTATFLCAETGIAPSVIANSTAYIAGWLKVLKNDPKVLVKSASKAQKASDLILGRTPPKVEDTEE
jgi:antirestriction protein ArdC